MSGVGARKLTGVALLRHMHITRGHTGVRSILLELQAMGREKSCITREDIQAFIREGCGTCETAKMKRRSFTIQTATLTDRTRPHAGKVWVCDSLELRVPTAHHGYTWMHVCADRGSTLVFVSGMVGQSSEDIVKAREQLRVYVRPVHGEIEEMRSDSHPTHLGRHVNDYMALSSTGDTNSPPHVKEGAVEMYRRCSGDVPQIKGSRARHEGGGREGGRTM